MSERCEAMVLITTSNRSDGLYFACGEEPAHEHHKLTRARGGLILDAYGEDYHRMWLCPKHHAKAHDEPALSNGLLIAGSVVTHPLDGKPLYHGPDEYLTEKYGPAAMDR